jgi:hypothetical protein
MKKLIFNSTNRIPRLFSIALKYLRHSAERSDSSMQRSKLENVHKFQRKWNSSGVQDQNLCLTVFMNVWNFMFSRKRICVVLTYGIILFDPEDGSCTFLWNVGRHLTDYTGQHTRTLFLFVSIIYANSLHAAFLLTILTFIRRFCLRKIRISENNLYAYFLSSTAICINKLFHIINLCMIF